MEIFDDVHLDILFYLQVVDALLVEDEEDVEELVEVLEVVELLAGQFKIKINHVIFKSFSNLQTVEVDEDVDDVVDDVARQFQR